MAVPGLRRGRTPVMLVACALIALAAAPSAAAHAELLKTEPSNDAVVAKPPARVSLLFNEPIESAFGAVRVYDAGGRRVDSGQVERPTSREVAVRIDPDLHQGTYTATWRIISADGHPLRGAFVFHVGAPGARPAGIAADLDEGTPRSVSTTFTVVRFLDLALLLLAVGGTLSIALVFKDADARLRRLLAGILAVFAVELVPVALLGIVLQGAVAGGFGLGKAFSWDVFSAVLDTRFGRVWLAQAALAALLAVLAVRLRREPGRSLVVDAALLVAAGLVLTPALSGHASVGGPLAFLADVVHVQAAAAWTGGLAFLVLGLLATREDRWPLAARVVPRFSRIAVLSVSALLLSGVVNGYLEVRTWRGLWETTYGLVLLAKLALVVPLLLLGAYNNRFAVPRLRVETAVPQEQRRFLRTAGAELGLMVAVVAVTAVLVAQPPAKAEVAPRGPYSTSAMLGSLELDLVVDPAVAGPNEIHLYFTDASGQPTEVADARVSAELPSRGIGPLRLEALKAEPGHRVVRHVHFALPGDWQLTVEVRRGEFESVRRTVSVPIRKD